MEASFDVDSVLSQMFVHAHICHFVWQVPLLELAPVTPLICKHLCRIRAFASNTTWQ
jgi:hypothetical protein